MILKDFKESRILQLIAGLAEQWGGAEKVRELKSTLRSVTNHPDYLRHTANLGDAASENLVTAAVLGISIAASVKELVAGQNPRCFEINAELLAACESALKTLETAVRAGLEGFTPEVEDDIVAGHSECVRLREVIRKAKGAQPQ